MNIEQKLFWILDPDHDYKTEGSDMHDFAQTTVQVRRFHRFACEVSERITWNGIPKIKHFSLYIDTTLIFNRIEEWGPEDYLTTTLGELADLITSNESSPGVQHQTLDQKVKELRIGGVK